MDTSGKSAVKFLMKNILAKPADLKFLYVKKKKKFFLRNSINVLNIFSLSCQDFVAKKLFGY